MKTPAVLRKHGARHALLLTKGRKLYSIVEMEHKRLQLRKMTEQEVLKLGYKVIDDDPVLAADTFLNHKAGLSPAAYFAVLRMKEGTHDAVETDELD